MPNYDHTKAMKLKKAGWTNQECAAEFGYSNESGFRRRWNRELKAREEVEPEPSQPIEDNDDEPSQLVIDNDEPELTIDDTGRFRYGGRLIESVTYGHIKATDHRRISEDQFKNLPLEELALLVDDWIREFFQHQYSWTPTPDYLMWIMKRVLDALRNCDFTNKHDTYELTAILKLLILIARFHGKTTLMLGLFAWWTIDQKKSLTIITNPGKKKDLFITLLNTMKSPMIRFYYGDFIERSDATEMKVVFLYEWQKYNHDAMLNVATLEGGYVGTHAKWTHLEDPIQKLKASKSSKQRMRDEFDDNLRDLSAVITVTATRKGPDDFYAYLMLKGFLELRKDAITFYKGDFPTIDDIIFHESGSQRIAKGLKQSYVDSVVYETLGCPDFPFLRLMLRYWDDKNSFYSQFMNQPKPRAGGYFEDYHYFETELSDEIINSSTCYIVIDPAFGKSTNSSDTAIIAFVIYAGAMYLLEILVGKYNKEDIAVAVLKIRARHKHWGWAKIEDDFAQVTNRFESGWTTKYKIGTFKSGGEGTKLARIEQLYSPFQFREVQVLSRCRDKEKLENQIIAYNHDPNGRWDILDAVATGYRLTKKQLNAAVGTGVTVI